MSSTFSIDSLSKSKIIDPTFILGLYKVNSLIKYRDIKVFNPNFTEKKS